MKKMKLTCHCDQVEAEINISEKLDKKLRCNCSICKEKEQLCQWSKIKILKLSKGPIN